MSPRTLARLILDAAALSWVSAVAYGASAWLGDPVPFWLPLLAYILTALARRGSQRLGLAAMVLVCVAGALAEGRPDPMAFLVAAGVSLRALTTQKDGAYWALRSEFITGLWLVVVVAIVAASGRPLSAELLLPAVLVVGAGLFGMPYVHSLDAAGSPGIPATRSGMRLGGLILGGSALLSLLVEGLRMLYLAGQLGIIGTIAYYVYYPFLFVFYWIAEHLLGRFQFAQKNRIQGPKPVTPKGPPKPHALSPHALFLLHLSELALLLLAAGLILYFIYRRTGQEDLESGELNAAPGLQAIAYTNIVRPRRRLHFGEGARGRVRAAVGHHVLPHGVAPAETARTLAEREGWPEETLAAYERARYRLEKPFEDEEATSFLRRFAAWRDARRRP